MQHDDRIRRAWTTLAAAGLIVLVTLPFLDAGVGLARSAFDPAPPTGRRLEAMIRLGIPASDGNGLVGASAALTLALCAWSFLLAAGLLARREWARFGGMLTFAFFGLMLVPLTVGGIGETSSAWIGVTVAAAQVLIVWLLWSRRTADDIDDAEWLRQRRRADRGNAGLIRRFRVFLATARADEFRDA
jgi:hypothetical protein